MSPTSEEILSNFAGDKPVNRSTNNSANSFVQQIMDEYRAIDKAKSDALSHALKCGHFLNLAKENLSTTPGKAKGWWDAWRDKETGIPQETASLYQRLAVRFKEDETFFDDCMSIRQARTKLSKYDPDGKKAKRRAEIAAAKEEAKKAAGLTGPKSVTPLFS